MNILIEKEEIKKQIDMIDNEEFISVIKNLFSFYAHQKQNVHLSQTINTLEKEKLEKDNFFDICGIWENHDIQRSKAWRTQKW